MLLTTGFLARGGEELAGAAALVAYAVIYLFVLVFAISLSRHGAALPVAFTALFVGTQALRFPVFETAEPAISGAAPFTLAAAALALAELAALTWAARRFVSAPEEGAMRAAALIVGVAALHGALAGWQGPLLVGELSVGAATGQALRWLGLVVVQVGTGVGGGAAAPRVRPLRADGVCARGRATAPRGARGAGGARAEIPAPHQARSKVCAGMTEGRAGMASGRRGNDGREGALRAASAEGGEGVLGASHGDEGVINPPAIVAIAIHRITALKMSNLPNPLVNLQARGFLLVR